jgi:hypothetical protein
LKPNLPHTTVKSRKYLLTEIQNGILNVSFFKMTMRSESIKLKWALGESHSELRSQSLKHGPASLYFDNLKQAILNGDIASLKEFLGHEDYRSVVNFKGPDGYALIHIAALQTDCTSIDVLVDAGTRPNLHDSEGKAALHLVVSRRKGKHKFIFMFSLLARLS